MDAFQKNCCLWLVARGSKKPAHSYCSARIFSRLLMVLVACASFSGTAQANSFLDSYVKFNHKLAQAIMKPMHDGMGVQLESVNVDYLGQPVSFQYQMWRLRQDSVCKPLKNRSLLKYSECTEAASQFFRETCQSLTQNPTDTYLYPQYKRLYCNAAAEYQPTIAKIRRSKPQDDQAAQRQQCSMLIIKASRTRKTEDVQERDRVCGGNN